MEKSRKIFVCECGYKTVFNLGRCPQCQEWHKFTEQLEIEPKASSSRQRTSLTLPEELSQVDIRTHDRFPVPVNEFNRVLGGGIVPGSVVLIGGEPGIGKSTLLLQIAALAAGTRGNVVYVSGEETTNQIKLRANRLGIRGDGLFLISETDIESV